MFCQPDSRGLLALRKSLSFFLVLLDRRASLVGKYTVQLFNEGQKFLVVMLNRDFGTEFVNPGAFFLSHASGSITGLGEESMFGVERMMDTGENGLTGIRVDPRDGASCVRIRTPPESAKVLKPCVSFRHL
jgi:hypothetical protein